MRSLAKGYEWRRLSLYSGKSICTFEKKYSFVRNSYLCRYCSSSLAQLGICGLALAIGKETMPTKAAMAASHAHHDHTIHRDWLI
jgi:hypothetical protein